MYGKPEKSKWERKMYTLLFLVCILGMWLAFYGISRIEEATRGVEIVDADASPDVIRTFKRSYSVRFYAKMNERWYLVLPQKHGAYTLFNYLEVDPGDVEAGRVPNE